MSRIGGRPRLRPAIAPLLLASLLLPACGGGGGGGSPLEELYLGTVACSAPTRVEVVFANPLGAPATVSFAGSSGPFTADLADLPAFCGAGEKVTVGVICEPETTEDVEGTISLRFDAGAQSREKRWRLWAWAEPPVWAPASTVFDFGWVFLDDSVAMQVGFRNESVVSPVVINRLDMPADEFRVVGSELPLTIPPGSTSGPILRFTPTTEGVVVGDLVVGSTGPEGLRYVTVRGEGRIKGREVVTDFGVQSLDASGRTAVLSVNVPPDAVSLSLEGLGAAGDVIGLDTLTGPDGTVYENGASTGPYQWYQKFRPLRPPPYGAFLTTLPNSDRTGVQLVPGGGAYTFSLRSTGSTVQVRAIVERRAAELAGRGVLDLNVFLSTKIAPTAATAEEDEVLQAAIARLAGILEQAGIRLGDIDYYDLSETISASMTPEYLGLLFGESSQAEENRLNVFLYQRISIELLGASGAIGGPKRNGTPASGVYALYGVKEGEPWLDTGAIIAHEIGHYLGLFHLIDSDGTPDIIDDSGITPPNLMYYSPTGTYLSAGQTRVMRGHPHVRTDMEYAIPWEGQTLSRLGTGSRVNGSGLTPGWCGTCRR